MLKEVMTRDILRGDARLEELKEKYNEYGCAK